MLTLMQPDKMCTSHFLAFPQKLLSIYLACSYGLEWGEGGGGVKLVQTCWIAKSLLTAQLMPNQDCIMFYIEKRVQCFFKIL